MKLLLLLAVVTLAQAGQLDRVYLPPNAGASAGSNFLQTPHQSSNGFNAQSNNAYSPISNNYEHGSQLERAYLPPNSGSDFIQTAEPSSNGFNAQSTNAYSSNNYAQNAYSSFEARPERAQAARERNAAILRQDNSNDGETYSYAYETENGIYAEESGVATNGVQAQGGYSYTGDDGQVYSVRYTADENGFVPQGDHLPTPPPIPEAILKSLEKIAQAQAAVYNNEGSYTEASYSGYNQEQYYNSNTQPINYNSNTDAVGNTYLPPQRNLAPTVANTYLQPQRNSATISSNYLPPQRNSATVANNYLPPQRNSATVANNYLPPQRNSATVANNYLPPQRNSVSVTNNYLPPLKNSATIGNTYLPPQTLRNQY